MAGAALGPLVLQLSACGGDDGAGTGDPTDDGSQGTDAGADVTTATGREPTDSAQPSAALLTAGAVLVGLYPGDGMAAMTQAASKLDFSWLEEGDSVLIKVASNSGNPHPAVTSPAGVAAMVAHLKSLGAGRVVVADQAGVEWVRNTATGRFSSTRERWMANGLLALEGDAEAHFFDDGEWESGYVEATLPSDHRWPRGMRVAAIIEEVDHIIYMPRVGAHTLAGLTLGHKSAIGWLRDDTRHDLHNDAQDFYEKYTEVNYIAQIQARFRMVVTVAEKVLLFGGPDEGTEYEMSPALVIASTRLANHDAMACSVLVTLQNTSGATPAGMLYNAGTAALFNTFFAGGAGVSGTSGAAGIWASGAPSTSYSTSTHGFTQGLSKDRALARGWVLSGGKPDNIEVVLDGEPMSTDLMAGLEAHGEGLYSFG